MRKYKTSCFNCGKETRNTKKSSKPIDVCANCVKEAKGFDEKGYQKKLNKLIMPKSIKQKEVIASPPTTKVEGIRSETVL